VSGEVDARLRAAGEGPFLIFYDQMRGAPDNRATQMSLTLTLSRQRESELEGKGNWTKRRLETENR